MNSRWLIKGTLCLRSPMTLRTGETEPLPPGKNDEPQVLAIETGANRVETSAGSAHHKRIAPPKRSKKGC